MCKGATTRVLIATLATLGGAWAQSPIPTGIGVDWRHIGNSVIDRDLAGLASGPVLRVWYSANGSLAIQTASKRSYVTQDFESWQATASAAPPVASIQIERVPEAGASIRSAPGSSRLYAFGQSVYRSEDNGASWDNLTAYRGTSIVGTGLRDLAVSPSNPDELVVAGDDGIFRSMDGGKSWSGLNASLPNLSVTRILALPANGQGTEIALFGNQTVSWEPGEKTAWQPSADSGFTQELQLRQALGALRGVTITALAMSGNFVYTGMSNGQIGVSSDGGVTWQTFSPANAGAVARFWIDPNDARVALAVLGSGTNSASSNNAGRVFHTVNAGQFWDDFTANLPPGSVHGVTADRASNALYVAMDQGVFFAHADLGSLGAVQPWTVLAALPAMPAMDVRLDSGGNQLWVAMDGYGIYAGLAPHRLQNPSVVSAADLVARAAAPGSLISILGARADSVRAGNLTVPVLAATSAESQIQIPFEAPPSTVSLAVSSGNATTTLGPVTVAAAAPAIFVDPDGTPLILDADSGVMLDAMTPAHSGSRIQILASGLGRVTPDWPTGLAAPMTNPPKVDAAVSAYLDRSPVEITRAVLAPGYVGFYLVEATVPKIVNYGPAELYLEVEGAASNRVRIYIEP